MNDTEQLIKEALGKLADRTPHPGPTLNALRRKRNRHRNVFMIGVAGVAAAAVMIFGGLLASSGYQPPAHNDAAAVLAADKGRGVAIKYAPHWLPEGYAEVYRGTGETGGRAWVPAGAQGYPFTDGGPLTKLSVLGQKPGTAGWDEVAVRGLKAWVRTKQGQSPGLTAEVVWQAQDWLGVTVRGVDDARQTALSIAESVRADATVVHRAPFSLNGQDATQMWGTSPGDWGAQLITDQVVAEVSTRSPGITGGTPITLRGKPGVQVDGAVAVLDGPVWVTVRGDVTPETLIKHANMLDVDPSPDTSWIGKRAR